MYIGKAGSIIDLWKDFEKGRDDQRYATAKCSEGKEIFIDEDNYIRLSEKRGPYHSRIDF
tara:strand:+ start:191 stop:370 length:180 start_codon:yes stop_codon:yes gene_type:complete